MSPRKFSRLGLFAVTLLCAACNNQSSDTLTMAVTGDMPYGASQADTTEFNSYPTYIAAINADPAVSMVLHAGDTHSGKQYCTEAYNLSIYQDWAGFHTPFVYTPGDNEWADCHKKKEGGGSYNASTGAIDYVVDGSGNPVDYAGGDPVANLDLIRSLYFAMPGQTLGAAMATHSQAEEFDSAHSTDSTYVENVWFNKAGVLFATANIPGGSNNGTDPWYGAPQMSPTQQQEVTNRSGATLRWMDAVFAKATALHANAMVFMIQADMWDLDGNSMSDMHLTGYKQYIDKLAALSQAFGKPVLLINGDSHLYRSDNPLMKGAECHVELPSSPIGSKSTATESCADSVATSGHALNGVTTIADAYGIVQDSGDPNYVPSYSVPNFHRLVVHGNATPAGTDLEYIRLSYDGSTRGFSSSESDGKGVFGPFSWQRVQPMP